MLTKELIETLLSYPQDAEVLWGDRESGRFAIEVKADTNTATNTPQVVIQKAGMQASQFPFAGVPSGTAAP